MAGPADIPLVLGDWESLGAEATAIRHQVFVVEQHVPLEMELDEMDPLSLHVLAYDRTQRPIGTARLLPDGHIGRMAVLRDARSAGVGSSLLHALMAHARSRGDRVITLHAQLPAASFYAQHGYAREGEVFMDAGIAHITMRCVLR
jgi:predicted GNAT family N-acyltransferase